MTTPPDKSVTDERLAHLASPRRDLDDCIGHYEGVVICLELQALRTALTRVTRERDEWHGRASESVVLRRERDEARSALTAAEKRVRDLERYEHIEAQQGETGRMWWGARYKMPSGYTEVSNDSGVPVILSKEQT